MGTPLLAQTNRISIMKKIVVLYHNNCPDGFGAVWVAWKKFGNKALYVGVDDRRVPPPNLAGKDVYILDFGYPLEAMKILKEQARSVTAIDHHISLKDSVRSAHHYLFDLKHSGAVLAWKYFYPNTKMPTALYFIEDMDLGKFYKKKSAAFLQFLMMQHRDFKTWSNVIYRSERDKTFRDHALEIGSTLMSYQDHVIDAMMEHAYEVIFEGKKIFAVNINVHILRSSLGARLAQKKPPFSIVWRNDGDYIKVSLRSIKSFDVAKIAKKYGGGGHKNAAAFFISANKPLPWKVVKK